MRRAATTAMAMSAHGGTAEHRAEKKQRESFRHCVVTEQHVKGYSLKVVFDIEQVMTF